MSKKQTAAELMARLANDPAYVATMAEKKRAHETAVAANVEVAKPIVEELRAAGYDVRSLRELRVSGTEYASAVPVLLRWLTRVDNEDVKQEIIRDLSVPWARPLAAPVLIDEFRRTEDERVRWTIGNALEIVADDAVLDDMLELALNPAFGRAREMVVAGLGNLNLERVLPALIELLKHEEIAGYAVMALGKQRATVAKPLIEPFLRHKSAWLRKEAKRAFERIEKATKGAQRI